MKSFIGLLPYLPLALAAYALLWTAYARLVHPLEHIPGPFWASVTRLWMIHHVLRGDMDVVQRALHQKYGPLVRISPNETACADPEAIRKIYPVSKPLEKSYFYQNWHITGFSKYPDHFSHRDERSHSERRRIVNNVYSMTTILSLEQYIDNCSALFVKRMGEFADSGAVVDLGDWLQWQVGRRNVPATGETHCSIGMRSTSWANSFSDNSLDLWRIRMTTNPTLHRLTSCCL